MRDKSFKEKIQPTDRKKSNRKHFIATKLIIRKERIGESETF